MTWFPWMVILIFPAWFSQKCQPVVHRKIPLLIERESSLASWWSLLFLFHSWVASFLRESASLSQTIRHWTGNQSGKIDNFSGPDNLIFLFIVSHDSIRPLRSSHNLAKHFRTWINISAMGSRYGHEAYPTDIWHGARICSWHCWQRNLS